MTDEKPQDADIPVAKHISVEEVQPTAEERRLEKETLLRLDLLLMPMTLVLYFLAWLDRANVGNARIVGCFVSVLSSLSLINYSTGRNGQRSQPVGLGVQVW